MAARRACASRSRTAPQFSIGITRKQAPLRTGANVDQTYPDIAKMIDHSLLNPALPAHELEQGIQLALAYDVASVCILPYFLKCCADRLRGSTVKASTTIGFPHGG